MGVEGENSLKGYVYSSETNEPLPNSEIAVFHKRYRWGRRSIWNLDYHVRSDDVGEFKVSLREGYDYTLIASHDDKKTPGIDYVPQIKSVSGNEELDSIQFGLINGASVLLNGENFFVETTLFPYISYTLIDPKSNESIKLYGEYIQFGTGVNSLNEQLNLPSNQVIIPSETDVAIGVQAIVSTGDDTLKQEFTLHRNDPINLAKGDRLSIELGEYLFPKNLEKIYNESYKVSQLIFEKENEGFFLGVERQKITRIETLIKDSETYFFQSSNELAFTKLREAHLEITNLENWVNNMTAEAIKAISILLVFLSISGLSVSYLLTENFFKKILVNLGFYGSFITILYFTHPGSKLIQFSDFLTYGVFSFIGVVLFASASPYFLKGSGYREKVPIRNMMIPLFSIAKRSLRRRKLRFLLTLVTVTIMVTSFISLTSFTAGYGLVFKKVEPNEAVTNGVMIKSPSVPVTRARSAYSGGPGVSTDAPLELAIEEWFETRNETKLIIPKYYNLPQRQYREAYHPIGNFLYTPIFGVMAIDPLLENQINPIEESLILGRYFEEGEKGLLISGRLSEKSGIQPDMEVNIQILDNSYTLKVVGVFDDALLEDMMDLNGDSILPEKIVELSRVVVDGPDIIFEGTVPCNSDEVLITTIDSLTEDSGILLNRLNIILKEGWDLKDYAQKTALNRGLRAWAATSEGIYFAHLAPYFQGKGFPIVLPWIIVVLNVVVTMLNSYYERRKEIDIFSSIGMNPSHISGIFLAEASVIGLIGGSTGYLFGISAYKIMNILSPALAVKQKVSAIWSIASLGIALAAVLIGGIVALKSSINITPSLKRRWKVEDESKRTDDFEIVIPLKVTDQEINSFKNYLLSRLREEEGKSDKVTKMVKERTEHDQIIIDFIYSSADTRIGGFYSKNTLILKKLEDTTYYKLLLDSLGTIEAVQDWSLQRNAETSTLI
jgi:ABC-type lipoprotein release transport system permease subunit